MQHRGYGIRRIDDEVVAHLGQVIYYQNLTHSYNLSFMGRFAPIFTEAERIVRLRNLQHGRGQTVHSDDVRTLKRYLHDIAGY